MIDKRQINTVEKKYDAITNTVVNYKVTTTNNVEIFVPLDEANTVSQSRSSVFFLISYVLVVVS